MRGCDGRYFPITGPDNQGRVAACNSFCPDGRDQSGLRQQYRRRRDRSRQARFGIAERLRHRNEIVAGCTCNSKDQFGLAPVSIENDPTLRKGDIVAGADGLLVANPAAKKRAALYFSPLPELVRARFEHVPVVARE